MSDIPQATNKGTDANDLVNPNVLADIIADNEINNVEQQEVSKPAAETAPRSSGMHLTNYINETNRVLNMFAKAKEWSDFIGLLSSLEVVIKKYNTKTIKLNLVCLPLLTKRLTQCLNPVLPNGVHFKCIDVYKTILKILVLNSDSNTLNSNPSDPNHFTFIKTNFYMLFKPFFAFGENCRILVFKQYLEVIERFILPLYKIVVTNSTIAEERLPLKLILLGILPSMESEAADQFEKGYQLMRKLYEYYHIKSEQDILNDSNNLNFTNNLNNTEINAEQEENNNFSPIKKSFYLSLYKLFITNSSMRPFILNFMNKHKQSDLDYSSIFTYKIQTKAYCVAFEADVIALVRNAFEHTNSMFPLLINEETISDVNDKSNENINTDELYNLENNMTTNTLTTNTSNTTFEIKKKKDLTHTQNILYDKHQAELLELNNQLRVSAFKTFLRKESGIAKKYIKWIEGNITNNDNNDTDNSNLIGMVDNFEFLVNSNLLTNSIKLEIFIKAMVTLGERYSSEFVKMFLRKYFVYILMLLKPHVEKQVQMDKMPLEDIKGIELLKTLKIFIAANWNIYGRVIVEIVKEYFKNNKDLKDSKENINTEKNEEALTTLNILSIENNAKDISLDELTSLLSFTIAVFTEFDVNYYTTHLIDLTKIIMSNKLLLNKKVFHSYINIFYTVLELEEVIVKNSNSLYTNNACEYTSFVDKKYVALLAEEVFNIENYRSISNKEKSEEIIYEYDKFYNEEEVLENKDNKDNATFAFSNADLSYMVEFHRRFIRVNARTHTRKNKKSEDSAYSAEKKRGSNTTLNNNKNVSVTSLQNKLNSKENVANNDYTINSSFQGVLNAFILSDYSHAYVVHYMFTEKEQLYQKLIDDHSANFNTNDAFILEYINSSTIDAYIKKILKEESTKSNLLNLLSNNTNNELLIRPILTFMYYYHSNEQKKYSTYYNTIVSSITKWSIILEGIIGDIIKSVSNSETTNDTNLKNTENSLPTLLSTLEDIFTNTKALKEIKKTKPYHSLENNDHVLDKLHKVLENVVHNSDDTLFELILHLYYLLHVHGFYYKIKDVEISVEKYINSDNSNINNNLVVKYSAYMLNHDYILNKLLQYHKIILKEYTKKGVVSETDTIELVNRMIMASSKYFIRNKDNKIYSNANNSNSSIVSNTESLSINNKNNKKYDSQESNSSQQNTQDTTRSNINILVIWTDIFNTVDSKILNKCNLSAIYSKLLNYFISYSINNYSMKYYGHTLKISQSNELELENNENILDGTNLTNTSLSSGFISGNLYELSTRNDTDNDNISMDIMTHTTNYTQYITTLSQLLFKYNPVLFIKTLPCDISIVPLFTSYSIKLQNALYGYFLSKYSSDILFLLFNSHLSITSKTIIKSTLIKHKNNSNKLREMDIVLLLRIFSSSTINTIDASIFNLVTNSNILTKNTLMMLYAAVVGNTQLHKKFVEYLHRRIKKDNGVFALISEVVLESKTYENIKENAHENTFNSVTLLNSIIHNTYNNAKYSLIHYKNRNNLLISFAHILPTYLMSDTFFVGHLSQKYHTFELLSPYIDTSSIMNKLSYKLDNSFFSGSIPNKIFNIRRISFVLLSTYNYVDNKYLTTISEVIHDLLTSEINLKIELYRMIRVLLVMSKKNNLTNMLLLYPLVVEDMLIAIKSKNIKLVYTIMSVIDITLFLNIEYFDLRVVLKEYTKHVSQEGSDFFIDSSLNHITVNNNNDEKVKHLFSYSERTPAQLLSYAKNAMSYYGENNLAFKERDVEGLKKKILEQFEEREC